MPELTEVLISVRGLRVGMFVSRLDRPWIETPFALQGLRICNQNDIDRLARYCTHVYVDVEKGPAPEPRYVDKPGEWPSAGPPPVWLTKLRRTDYGDPGLMEQELPTARGVYEQFAAGIEDLYDSLAEKGNVDLAAVRSGMNAMVDSVLRNPDACGWLVRYRESNDSLYRHALGCAVWGAAFGRHLGLGRRELDDLVLGCILMDAGKTLLRPGLLDRSARLTGEELAEVREHVRHGLDLIRRNSTGAPPPIVRAIVAYHHERFDGRGYPFGLRGDGIPLYARIAAMIDCFDALTNARPHRAAQSPHEAIAYLYQQRGRRFQAELVEQFIQAIGIYPSGTLVELNSGEVAVVVSLNGMRRLKPRIMLLLDRDKQPYAEFTLVDLLQEPRGPDGQPLAIRRGLPPGAYGIRAEELYL